MANSPIAAPPDPAPGKPPAARRRRPKLYYGWYIAGAALVAQFVSVGAQMSVSGVMLVPMTEDLDWSRSEFTLGQVGSRFVAAFLGFFIGVYIDRYGGRALMIIGVTVMGVGLFLTSSVTELWQWLLLRSLLFTAGAALIGNLVVNVTLSKWFVEKRGRVIGISAMGVSLAGIVVPPLMTLFVDEFGWRAGWRLLAIASWALIYPAAMMMRRQPEDEGLHPDGKSDEEMRGGGGAAAAADLLNSFTRSEALRTSALYMIVLAFGLGGVGIGVLLLQTIPFLTDEGFSRGTAALMASTMSVPALISKPMWGWAMDRMNPKVLAAAGFVVAGVAIFVILAGAKSGSVPALLAGYLLMGVGFGGQIPLQETIWASYFGRRHLGAVRGVAMPFSLLIGAGAPYLTSLYFDRVGNYDGAFIATGLLWFAAAGIVLMVRRPVRPGQRAPVASAAPPVRPPPSRPPPDGRTANGRLAEASRAANGAAAPAGHEHGDADGAPAPAPRRIESSPLYDGAPPRAVADDGRADRRASRGDGLHGDGDETGEGRRASRRAAADALYTGVSTERDSSKG